MDSKEDFKVHRSLIIDSELWKKFKHHCVEKGVTISEQIRLFIMKELKGGTINKT